MKVFELIQMVIYATLGVAMVSFSGDSWDPVDDWVSNATVLVIDETIQTQGPHSLDAADTNDWFQFSFSAEVPYLLEAKGSIDTDAFLYSDPEEIPLTIPDGSYQYAGEGENFRMVYFPAVSGDYYLKVKLTGAAGEYTLQYTIPSADTWDPLDNIGTNATTLTMGEVEKKFHGPHVLDETDYYDWFSFNLSSGIVYRFESVGDSDTKGYLYEGPLSGGEKGTDEDGGDGWKTDSDDDGDDFNFRIDYLCHHDGEYYVLVRSYTVGDNADYDLRYYIPANDTDDDQLLDSWEIQYFGSTNAQPNADADSDQLANLGEYIAGTDPTNGASFFVVTNELTSSGFIFEWRSIPNREYRVFWEESMTNNFQQISSTIDYPQNSYTDTVYSVESSGFYNVEIQIKW